MKRNFKIVSSSDELWKEIEATYDSCVYKTKNWYEALKISNKVDIIIIEVSHNNQVLGWFTGGVIKKFGFKIIASPFEGWGTSYQGLSLIRMTSKSERIDIISELKDFLFRDLRILFFQIADWQLDNEDLLGTGIYTEQINSYMLDIAPSVDELFKSFKQKSCQYSIRKAQKNGIIVKEPIDLVAFGHEYYKQLEDVFIKQNLKPTYDENRVQTILSKMDKDKNMVVLEALHPETNKSMACVIFFYHNELAFYWGASSWREYQKLCPNELLMFESMKILRERGCKILEMEGIRAYKEKYNPVRYSKPKLIFARFKCLITAKNLAKQSYYGLRKILHK